MHLFGNRRDVRDALLGEATNSRGQLLQKSTVIIGEISRHLHIFRYYILVEPVRFFVFILQRGDIPVVMLLLAAVAVISVPDTCPDGQQEQDSSNHRDGQNQPFLAFSALLLLPQNIVVINGIVLTDSIFGSRVIDRVPELVRALQMHHRLVGRGRFGDLI